MRELDARLMAAGLGLGRTRRQTTITRPVVFVLGVLVGFLLAGITMLANSI